MAAEKLGCTINEIKDGLRPACLTQVRICEPGAPLQICGERTVASMVSERMSRPLFVPGEGGDGCIIRQGSNRGWSVGFSIGFLMPRERALQLDHFIGRTIGR